MTQFDRDQQYHAALSVFKSLHRNGLVSESEFVKIAAFLAERFSASEVAKMPEFT